MPRAPRGARAPHARRGRRRVRRTRRREPAHPLVPAGDAHRPSGEDGVLPQGVVPRARAPPPGAHLDAPQRRARRHPRELRDPHRARRRCVPVVVVPRHRQRGVLLRRPVPHPERAGRGLRRAHQQPAVRCDARLRRGAGGVRARGPDGSARGGVRRRPDRAAAPERARSGRRAAHRPAHHRHAAGGGGHPRVRGAPAAGAGRRRRARATWGCGAHERRGRRAARRRVRSGLQEPHVRRGLRRLLDRALLAHRRCRHRHVRGRRGGTGVRHPGAAVRRARSSGSTR